MYNSYVCIIKYTLYTVCVVHMVVNVPAYTSYIFELRALIYYMLISSSMYYH